MSPGEKLRAKKKGTNKTFEFKVMEIFGYIGIGLIVWWVILALFYPLQQYRIDPLGKPLDSGDYVQQFQALVAAPIRGGNKVTVYPNGENFYPAMLEAIRGAQRSVDLEAYMFSKGEIMQQFVDALTERVKAGVKVNVVLDGLGSLKTTRSDMRGLIDAGAAVQFYHPLRWYTFNRYNNRTHRELLIVDGRIGFIGGPGIADHWIKSEDGKKRWRDTVVRIEGPAAGEMQGVFAENWVEASGRIISGPEFFPLIEEAGDVPAMVVASPAGAGTSSRARILMQMLVANASKSIYICTPYFLPDKDARRELKEAKQRGVDIKIITPGYRSDHKLTSSASRRLYGELIQEGIEIYEYRPGMIHQKLLVVDGVWSVVGSTNFDNRSFHLNDEVNVAFLDGGVTQHLTELYLQDLKESHRVTYDEWKNRPLWEKTLEWAGKLIERQQ